jgi:alanyl aminopeptidase
MQRLVFVWAAEHSKIAGARGVLTEKCVFVVHTAGLPKSGFRMKCLVFLTGLLLSSVLAMATETADYRLPAGIEPVSQSIELRLDPSQTDFSGHTTIKLTIERTTDRIGINQVGLDMTNIVLSSAGEGRPLRATNGDWQTTWLADGNEITPGDYVLTIDFRGKFSTDALGMYRASFEDNDYLFTQMEAMYARRAFPVFDEPAFKIPYTLTIFAPAGLVVIANMPVASATEQSGWQRVEFATTPPLPSYLLAYAVGPLDRIAIDGMSVPGYVYMPKGHAGKAGFVIRETPTIVAALEDYFGLRYPFPKLDFVAVPEFAFGAMENPGLITYRTELLLVGDKPAGKQAERVLMVIAHEVAHIWYGDLVTMAWWDDLWLNEAFASWMAWSVMASAYPQYESELKLPQVAAFPADQRTSAKPIRRTVRNDDEIVDGIGLNYTKGHALLRMLEQYVGHEVWQRAIQNYIEEFAWSNASERDLWNAVSDESGLSVYEIAGAYLNQPGFATVTIGEDGKVSQQRYLTEGREAADLEWQIPLNVKYKSKGEIRQAFLLLKGKTGSLDIPGNSDWIFPDAGGNGYYRWITSLEQHYKLVDDVNELTDREKIALLDNSEALLNAGDLSLADYMSVLNALILDPHPLVLLPSLEKLITIGEKFIASDNRDSFARYVDQAVAGRLQQVGVESRSDDSEAVIQMRPRLVRVLGQFGADEAVRDAGASLTDAYFKSAESVESGLALEAMRITALNDDGGRYEQFQSAYLNSDSADQKSNILSAFYFDNPDVVRRHLDFSISASVPSGDAVKGLGFFAYILEDDSVLYAWLEENLDALQEKIPEFRRQLLPQIVGDTCNAKSLAMLREFFGKRGDMYSSSLAQAVETAESCIDRRNRHADDLQQFLRRYDAVN